jgi:tetratricopeptide (TPR) repeat protein
MNANCQAPPSAACPLPWKPKAGSALSFLLAAFLLAPLAAPAADPLVEKGFEHFYSVEYPEAIAAFEKAAAAAPADPARQTHLAQAILFSLMYRSGALESQLVTGTDAFVRRPKVEATPEEEKRFQDAIARALELTHAGVHARPPDPAAMYVHGVALGLRGTYNFLVRRAWLDALRDLTAGRKLHNRVIEAEPSRIDARMMQGVHDYVVGSLPWAYRALGFLAGFRGDREQGIRTLQLVAQKGVDNQVDAMILLGVAYRRERRSQDAVPLLEELERRYPRNFLFMFELAEMYADLGRRDDALATLSRIEERKRSGAPGFKTLPAERIEYARGNLLFWFERWEDALAPLRRATAGADHLNLHTAQMAWLRLGQSLDLTGARAEAQRAYRSAAALAPSTPQARDARRLLQSPFTREAYFQSKT